MSSPVATIPDSRENLRGNTEGQLTAEQRALLNSLLEEDGIEPTSDIRARPDPQRAPLSWQQERLWFLEKLDPGTSAYILPIVARLYGPINHAGLERALNQIVARHEALRTGFVEENAEAVQRIWPHCELALPVHDLSQLAADMRKTQADRIAIEEIRRPFALHSAPLLRACLLRLAEEDHRLVITMHHLVSDGWSIGVLLRELFLLHAATDQNAAAGALLPALPIQYGDFAQWQRSQSNPGHVEGLAWWKKQLSGALPFLQLPTDKPRPAVQTMHGNAEPVLIDEITTSRIRAFCHEEGVTLFMFLLAIFQILLYKYSGQDDILVGTPVAGRFNSQTEPLIGLFLNTIVIRGNVSGQPSFRDFLKQIRETALAAYDRQEIPFERLVQEIQPVRDLSRSPIFQILFTLQVPLRESAERFGVEVELESLDQGTSKYEITLHLREESSGLIGYLEYNTDLFEHESIRGMVRHFRELVDAALEAPEKSVVSLSMLSAEDRSRIIFDWNGKRNSVRPNMLVHELVTEQARQSPEAIAILCDNAQITYRQLDTVSNQFARRLRALGAGPGMLVGLALDRSIEMVVAALAVLKTGAGYVPLDPDFPQDRLAFMLEDSGAPVLVTRIELCGRFPDYAGIFFIIEEETPRIQAEENLALEQAASGDDLAYVIFTSGSTGKPKGVMIPHRALSNFLESMKREPGCTPRDVFLAITTLSFDIAALELYLPLITGARLVIASRQTARDGPLLDKEIERRGATMMQATPSGWQLLIESGWRGDRRLTALCGGEAISEHLATRLLERTAGLWNMYGPTETTIWSLIHRVERPEPHIPIGRPINNTTVYILGPAGDIVPPGAAGELHIGGEGLARGYFGRSDLTTDRFIPNPLPECSGERLYKTGDLARWRRNGLIECLGRTDNQIKIRGYRIELGEVEAALRACPDVVDAVVAAREDHRGGKRLVGYVQTKLGSAPSLPEEIRRLVRERLPDYMVPAFIIPLNEFPKTANNKIDRKLLPDPVRESIVSECVAHVAPRDELEERLAAIWLDVLGLKNIGIRDNFFELGGHSLLAARLFAAIEHVTGSHIPLATLFRSPTIEDLAKTIRGGEWKVDWKPVVELKRGQSAPFFCIHSLGANLVSYKRLSMLLDADQQFYGLQPHGLDGKEEPHARIPDMAQAYLAEVRRIQPHGPWFLGGVCLGGVIAYEMAQQLKSQGEEIGLLLMIDSEYPAQPPYQRTRNHNLFIADWHAGEIMRLEAGHRWPYVRKKLGKAVRRIRVRNGDGGSFERAVERIRAANLKALSEYRPQPYDGKITLLWSSEASARCYEDRRLSWSAVARGLEVHVVPGNHLTMIEPPNLEVLASKMNSCLQSAREMCGRALPEEARVTAASA